MKVDEKFNQVYNDILEKNHDLYKQLNQNSKKTTKNILLFFAVIVIVFSVFAILRDFNFDSLVILKTIAFLQGLTILLVTIFCIYTISVILAGNKRKIQFKTRIIKPLVESFDQVSQYMPDEPYSITQYQEADFESFDTYYSGDLIIGNSEGYDFSIAKVLTRELRMFDKSNYKTLFDGIVSRFEIPQNFSFSLYIKTDNDDQMLLKKSFLKRLPISKFKVDLDSAEFEKIFDVYCSNRIFAMRLLTADVMQTLLEFHDELKTDFEITIKGNAINMRFFANDTSTISFFSENSMDEEVLYSYYKMLELIFDLSSMLKKQIAEIEIDK